jgi:hypothetical protein
VDDELLHPHQLFPCGALIRLLQRRNHPRGILHDTHDTRHTAHTTHAHSRGESTSIGDEQPA